MKRTALYNEHVKLKGKIIEFGGWNMPLQYAGITAEHEACRRQVGLFDVSHMGEISVKGKHALDYLNKLVTNDVSKIADNQAQYTVMCYENGGCVDDLIIHRISGNEFFICVNASNTDKDFDWFKSHVPPGSGDYNLTIENISSQYTQIALQGRSAEKILQKLTKTELSLIKYYWFVKSKVMEEKAIIARTGYTGEDGFEIYIPWDSGAKLWCALLEVGEKFGIKPCGLGARDTLRIEMKYPLYGHEIDPDSNPLEAGLAWVVKPDKGDFIGKKALLEKTGRTQTLVGLKSLDRVIPRQGYNIEPEDSRTPCETENRIIGKITSGTLSPMLKYGIAIARLEKNFSKTGTRLNVVVRDRRVPHEVVKTPFYKRDY